MFTLGVSFDAVLIRIKASALRRLRLSVQRNDREDQPENLHPAPTSNVPTIKRVPYHDTAAAFRRLCRWEFVIASVGCGDGVPRGGSGEAIVMRF
jgi:hypothetical protein